MKMLFGAVGYRFLRDHSAAFAVLERLSTLDLGPNVVVEDISYNPIALVQWLQGEARDTFDRIVFVAAVERAGRRPGRVEAYRWDGTLPSDVLIQQAVSEAVTGVISVENTVVIGGHLKAWPSRVAIVEIEPREHEFGTALTADVVAGVDAAVDLLRALAEQTAVFDALPLAGLPIPPEGARAPFGVRINTRDLSPDVR